MRYDKFDKPEYKVGQAFKYIGDGGQHIVVIRHVYVDLYEYVVFYTDGKQTTLSLSIGHFHRLLKEPSCQYKPITLTRLIESYYGGA